MAPTDMDVSLVGVAVPLPIFSAEDLTSLCTAAVEHFQSQPICLRIDSAVVIVGDLHGSIHDLLRIIRLYGLTQNFLFLGDYVDRGQFSIECISLLFTLALTFPRQFMLLRGNHEMAEVAGSYGFKAEIQRHYPEQVFDAFCEAFSWMPLVAVVQGRYFCVHGGIGPSFQTLAELEGIKRPIVSDANSQVIEQLLWADPSEKILTFTESPERGRGGLYGASAVKAFLEENSLETIVRAHQCVDGVQKMAGMSVVTVFSASNYRPERPNESGVLTVALDGKLRRYKYPPIQKVMRGNAHFLPMSSAGTVSGVYIPKSGTTGGRSVPDLLPGKTAGPAGRRRLSDVVPTLKPLRAFASMRSRLSLTGGTGRHSTMTSFTEEPAVAPDQYDNE
jgi:diadenosine tetraphosphatase ApaH/serine/threonine PP2A family protein phosphatase